MDGTLRRGLVPGALLALLLALTPAAGAQFGLDGATDDLEDTVDDLEDTVQDTTDAVTGGPQDGDAGGADPYSSPSPTATPTDSASGPGDADSPADGASAPGDGDASSDRGVHGADSSTDEGRTERYAGGALFTATVVLAIVAIARRGFF